jgi:hypothetical protein
MTEIEIKEDENDNLNIENNNDIIEIDWRPEHEKILIDWADKAMCYKWLHNKCETKYYRLKAFFSIPIIIISTLTGTANFAIDRFPEEIKSYATIAIGSFNIFAGILGTVERFLRISELNESHRVSSISWDKFYRNIRIELAKAPDERTPVLQLLKICKEEFDRLMEVSPSINQDIIDMFKVSFENTTEFQSISKPEILDTLTSAQSFKYIININEENERLRIKQENNLRKSNIEKFINNFKNVKGRFPLPQEINDNINIKVSEIELENILSNIANKNIYQQNKSLTVSDIL